MTERDPDFDPNNKKQKLRAHIPGARSSIPEVVKKELSKLGQYCMLTLEPSPIDIAHIIAKTTPKCKRNLFEAAWNKELDSLDVDSLENLMYLRSDLHRAFDEGRWALLPKLHLLIQISGAQSTTDLQRQYDLPDVVDLFSQFSTWEGKNTFEYQLLWLGKEKAPLLRRRVPAPSSLGFLCDGDKAGVSDACKRFQNRMAGLPEPDDSTPGSNATNRTDANIDTIDDATLRREYASLLAETTDLYHHCAALGAENARLCRCAEEPELSQLHNDAEDSIGATHVLDLISHYRIFAPPYTDFPLIESRVHPFFAIANAGEKLLNISNPNRFGPQVQLVLDLFHRWNRPLAPLVYDVGRLGTGSVSGGYDDGQTNNEEQASLRDEDTQDSSGGAPSYESSSNVPEPPTMGEDAVPSPTSKVIDWLTDANSAAAPQEESVDIEDTNLEEYRKEPSQQAELCQWEEWATSPPVMPELLTDYYDNSQLSSYHWALYHECVNLMAAPGAHHVPMPWSKTGDIRPSFLRV